MVENVKNVKNVKDVKHGEPVRRRQKPVNVVGYSVQTSTCEPWRSF